MFVDQNKMNVLKKKILENFFKNCFYFNVHQIQFVLNIDTYIRP